MEGDAERYDSEGSILTATFYVVDFAKPVDSIDFTATFYVVDAQELMMSIREVSERKQTQGIDEELIYSITTTNWASDPSSASTVVKDASNNDLDVTSDVASGSASISGDVITLPKILSLTRGHVYRVETKFVAGGNTYEAYFYIEAEL